MFKIIIFLIFGNLVKCILQQNPNKLHETYINKNEESARKFLQFYNSYNPVVLLIDDGETSRQNALTFIKNINRLNPQIRNLNFMIIKFNATGASDILANSKNQKQFEEILNEKINEKPTNLLGYENSSTGAVFFGILKAVQVLMPHSGIVIFMEKNIEDESLVQHALIEIAKKRIQVFVVWSGEEKEHLLKELSESSHGAFITSPKNMEKIYFGNFLKNIKKINSWTLILLRKNLHGDYNLNFPIDSDITGIHISITPSISRGILTTPSGYEINVLTDDVSHFSKGSFIKRDSKMHEIHLNTTASASASQHIGIWRFIVGNARTFYNLTIFAHTKLTTNAFLTKENQTVNHNHNGSGKKSIQLAVNGDFSFINNVSFVNKNGKTILDNVKFTFDKNENQYLTENIHNKKTKLKIDVENIPNDSFYAVINGKDSEGNDFERLSYVQNNQRKEFYLPPLIVDVGLGSELITQPFRQPQIYFEVTNNANSPTLVRFFCTDEKSILLSMNPWYRWINPHETATVRVSLTTRSGSYQDIITFKAEGVESVSKRVIVDVGTYKDDRTDPTLHYYFTSDCTSVIFGSCEDGIWSVEVKAKDSDSGLLQVFSEPRGLYFPNGFTTGTTEEVTGYYSESCCNPDLKLIAFDRQNNRKTRHLNAYHANLSPGAIAAIVLGILLLIIIIIAIVLLIRKKPCICWAKKDSYDLPAYRGPRRT